MNTIKPLLLAAFVALGICLAIWIGNQAVVSSETKSVGNLLQQDESAVVAAYNAGIKTKKEFDLVYGFVSESGKDAKWREVPWIPSLWRGVEVASEKKKPIFMWAMNGDPLGCV